jgi:two-component system phosphate regulon sensor histidine kinase PhoR
VATKNRQRIGYRRIVQLLVFLVIVPTALLLLFGIFLIARHEETLTAVLGILTVSIVSVVVTGVVLVLVFIRREANLSVLQADFVSKVSHELRTPLTAIRLFAETMQRGKGDVATQEKCLEALTSETERLTNRIERLLDWGRMEAGRKLYDLREESVKDILDEAIHMFSPPNQQVGSEFVVNVEISPSVPHVMADRPALVEAIGNLLSNAQKYGGNPPVVTLRAYADQPANPAQSRVHIEVIDNGEGIARPEHRRIFEKFYRIDDRLSRTREGSGLGLAIVKHIVKGHGGRIAVDSEKGKGSAFVIVLPSVTGREIVSEPPLARSSS